VIVQSSSIVSRSALPIEAQVNGEVVLLNLDRDRCYGLGRTGSDIWHRLENPVQVERLGHQLEVDYEAPYEVILADILKLLNELAAEDLIDVR
jgi:hypothetical protein